MIVGERNPLTGIMGMLGNATRVLVIGCGTCVTVYSAGGEKEVGILASTLQMKSKAGLFKPIAEKVTGQVPATGIVSVS
jgi:hypothetical protein